MWKKKRGRGRDKKKKTGRVVPECSISLIVVMTTSREELQDTLINRLWSECEGFHILKGNQYWVEKSSNWKVLEWSNPKLEPTRQSAESTQNTWLLSVKAISQIFQRPLPLHFSKRHLKMLCCVISLSAYVAIMSADCGLAGEKLSCEHRRGADCRIRLASQSQAKLCVAF